MPRVTTQIPHRRKRPMRSSPVTGPDRFPLLEKTFGGKARKEFPAADSDGLAQGTRGFLPSSLRIAVHRRLSSSSPLSSEELAGIIAWKMGVCKGGKCVSRARPAYRPDSACKSPSVPLRPRFWRWHRMFLHTASKPRQYHYHSADSGCR